jgi:hypothetical protein
LRNLVKPLIEGPYKPIEVDSLAEPKRNDDFDMLDAEIVGPRKLQKGLVEKPTLYDTIVTPTSTSILHGEQQSIPVGFNANSAVTSAFRNEAFKLAEGQLAIPVKIETSSLVKDAALSNYETPIFLSKKQNKLANNKLQIPKAPMLTPNLVATSAADAKRIQNSLSAAKTYKQKQNACINY